MYIETKDAQISGAVGRYSKKFAPGKGIYCISGDKGISGESSLSF